MFDYYRQPKLYKLLYLQLMRLQQGSETPTLHCYATEPILDRVQLTHCRRAAYRYFRKRLIASPCAGVIISGSSVVTTGLQRIVSA